MGAFRNILFGAVAIALAFSYQAYRDLCKPHEKPELGKTFCNIYPSDGIFNNFSP